MKYYKYSIKMGILNFLSIIFFIPIFYVIFLLDLVNDIDFNFIICYFFWMFIHELMHGIGFYISGVRDVFYGITLEKGIMWCMCKSIISKKSIIISLLFPFFFIGVFSYFIGLFINNSLLILLSLFNIVGSIGDLFMFFFFLRLPDFNYTDLDDCDSFILMSNSDLTKYKSFGLNLIECTNNLEKFKDHNLISISNFSKVVFIIFILVLLFKRFFM